MGWRIVSSISLSATRGGGEYGVCLVRGAGTYWSRSWTDDASAVVVARWSRDGGAAFDPAVTVLSCTHADAREWLEAAEHEYTIAEQLCRRVA